MSETPTLSDDRIRTTWPHQPASVRAAARDDDDDDTDVGDDTDTADTTDTTDTTDTDDDGTDA